jgi:hypothetical protein
MSKPTAKADPARLCSRRVVQSRVGFGIVGGCVGVVVWSRSCALMVEPMAAAFLPHMCRDGAHPCRIHRKLRCHPCSVFAVVLGVYAVRGVPLPEVARYVRVLTSYRRLYYKMQGFVGFFLALVTLVVRLRPLPSF